MKINFKTSVAELVVKRSFYLAWKACGHPVGMGVFQDRPNATEDDVWKNILSSGDYSVNLGSFPGNVSGDYVFGRMMKLNILCGEDWIEIPDSLPAPDYQGWSYQYLTYKALVDKAIEELNLKAEVKNVDRN